MRGTSNVTSAYTSDPGNALPCRGGCPQRTVDKQQGCHQPAHIMHAWLRRDADAAACSMQLLGQPARLCLRAATRTLNMTSWMRSCCAALGRGSSLLRGVSATVSPASLDTVHTRCSRWMWRGSSRLPRSPTKASKVGPVPRRSFATVMLSSTNMQLLHSCRIACAKARSSTGCSWPGKPLTVTFLHARACAAAGRHGA